MVCASAEASERTAALAFHAAPALVRLDDNGAGMLESGSLDEAQRISIERHLSEEERKLESG
jgi:hypothetical protein